MKAEDYIWEINREILIHAQTSKVWHIISSEGHLEKFHPFCKKNEVKVWDDSSHEDSIEYNNNRILNRNFYNWFEGKGFTYIRPKLANYLYSVLMGLKPDSETDQTVVRDQFGSHSWFS